MAAGDTSFAGAGLGCLFSFLYKILKNCLRDTTRVELLGEVQLGRRFRIDHFGGIAISGDAVFGKDCFIHNGVAVGLRHIGHRGAPILGNRVDINVGDPVTAEANQEQVAHASKL